MNSEVKLINSFNGGLTISKKKVKKYVFILCPPFNGSTVLYKILNTSPNISTFLGKTFNNNNKYMIPKGEGCTLTIKNQSDYYENRHTKDYLPNFKDLKERYDEHWDLDKLILCDKSPPYVHIAKEIETYFEKFGEVYFIAMIRSPYSCNWINSCTWDRFAKEQMDNIKSLKNVTYFTYEALVSYPEKIKEQILQFIPELIDINMNVSKIDGLFQNEARNQELTSEFRDRVIHQAERNEYLKNIPEVLDFFGYPFVHIG